MQVLKKFYVVLLCGILAACSTSTSIKDEGGADSYSTDIAEIGISNSRSFRVGMLLPLTGADAKYGIGLKNASLLALNNINNPNLVIQYYDTASTPAGARIAINNAVNQQAQLILGPLKSTEVSAISNETIYQGLPVIAFSTAPEVLQPTIYTLGLLIDEQIDRIISYAANAGRRNFALLIPDNNYGISVAKAAVKTSAKNNVNITTIAFYPPNTSDFSQIIQQMTEKGVNFDALLIPEGGVSLTAATAMFAYQDITYPQVLFLGTSIWEANAALKETSLQQSIYPSLTKIKENTFAYQYYSIFGEKPSSLYTLAYDAVVLADKLSKVRSDTINQEITSPDGFNGLNGRVRFFVDGSNQHSLDIMTIKSQNAYVLESGNNYFDKILEPLDPIDADTIYSVPEIIGKDASLAQVLIYGKTIDFVSPANISSRETLVEITPENSVNESGNFDTQTIVE